MHKNTLIVLFFLTVYYVSGQQNPVIIYYPSSLYKAHPQNWQVLPSPSGEIYSANTNGLLQGNGNSWDLYPLTSNKIIRSLCLFDNKLFSGSFGELGMWEKDDCGRMSYQNISAGIPDSLLRNEEIWHMLADKESLYLQSFSLLLRYRKNKFQKINTPGTILFLQLIRGKKLVPILEKGIYTLNEDNSLLPLPGTDFFKNKIVTGILPFHREGSYLITTNDDGVFVYENNQLKPWIPSLQHLFKEVQINKAIQVKNGLYLLGSINAGLYAFTAEGKMVYHFHAGNGLYNNTVLSLATDYYGDVWAGLDKGLACIKFSNPHEVYHDAYSHFGSVYAVREHQGSMYMATNQGVYMYKKNEGEKFSSFRLIPGTQGQSWQLFTAGNHLYCGHNDGTLLIEKGQGKNISPVTGGWYNESIPGTLDKMWLQGNYTGLSLLSLTNGKLTHIRKIEGYNYPVKKFVFYNKSVWVTGPNLGLQRLSLDSAYRFVVKSQHYHETKGIKNGENIDLFTFRDTLRVYNGQQHYYYDASADTFKEDPFFSAIGSTFIVRPLEKGYWLKILQDKVVVMLDHTAVKIIPVTMTKDYHNVSKHGSDRYLLCLDDGYFMLSLSDLGKPVYQQHKNLQVFIYPENQRCLSADSLQLPGGTRSFSIQFYDHIYARGKEYQYRILPVLKDWKPTHTSSSVQVENLHAGQYTLEIRRNDGISVSVPFSIRHPWYSGWPARCGYVMLAIGLIFLIRHYHEKQLTKAGEKYASEQKRLRKQHETELENQKLHHENQLKNRELANSALQLVQKNEILQDIKNELIEIRKSSTHTLTAKDFQVLMKQINENLTAQEDKNLFDTSFEEMHEVFISALKLHYPSLTRDDLRLAAYLRMEMPTKEIAPLFNLSVRGLENKRYRLRKKLGLSSEDSLTAFFRQIEKT